MSSNGKRDVLRSIDYLLCCHIAYSYFLDASLLVLFFHILLQLQLLSPRSLNRTLRTALAIVSVGWIVCLLLHATTEPGQAGIIIDFIGNQHKPSMFRLFMLDSTIYLLQIVRVLITSSLSSQLLLNGTVVTTITVPPGLATALGAESVTLMLPPREGSDGDGSNTDDLFYHNELVVDIELRNSIRNIMYAEMEDPSTARDGSERLPV
ncbi:hypothetical protein EDC96DRAFT_506392 [Choanephora cucurbitarum]|nr:hypothetical protein EDC96DRAFT_506392 [Choanephora cucurbitarum]